MFLDMLPIVCKILHDRPVKPPGSNLRGMGVAQIMGESLTPGAMTYLVRMVLERDSVLRSRAGAVENADQIRVSRCRRIHPD